MKKILLGVLLFAYALIAGCAAVGTAVKHKDLETQTKMSKSVFLDPVPVKEKTVYVQTHNTTDKPNFDIKPALVSNLEAKGYRVVSDYSKAHYLLQVNLLQVGKNSKTAAEEMMGKGYGGTMEGAVAGGAMAAAGGGYGHVVAGSVGGALVTTVADNMVKDVLYSGIVDVKITEKQKSNAKPKIFKTRILTTADKVNLKFSAAQPILEKSLGHSIAGIF